MPWPLDAQDAGRADRHQVEQAQLVRPGEEAEDVRGQEGDLEHVVPAERVVGVLDVVLPERDGQVLVEELAHGQVQRTGVRVADTKPEAGARGPGRRAAPATGRA